jgi:hypothetical protein
MVRMALVVTLLVAATTTARAQETSDEEAAENTGPATNEEVFAKDASLEPGTNVALENVRVLGKSGNLLRVGHGRRSLFVAPMNPSLLDLIPVGAIINVRGMLREAPSATQTKVIFATSKTVARRLARQRVYVDNADVSLLP